jgi:hypothetical protein
MLLAACAPAPHGPVTPIALEQVADAPALDVSSARQTVLSFLAAYAGSGRDGGQALSRLVAGTKLDAWVRWLGVQDREFAGTIDGAVDVRSIRFAGEGTIDSTPGAQVDLGASVTFSYVPADGAPFQRTRILDGPVTLIRTGAGDWRVVDATRDGTSMATAIQLFRGARLTRAGVSVELDSLFAFAPDWQFNVLVHNSSGAPVVLDPTATAALAIRQPGGGTRALKGTITRSLVQVPDGATVAGLVGFPFQDSTRGLTLVLPYRLRSGRMARIAFALDEIVTPAQGPPTSSGSPSPSG